jgi:CelD/BcsL family acetyltransferase involved in cellulose biosynthesis
MASSTHLLELESHETSAKPEVRVGGVELLEVLGEAWNRLCQDAGAEPFLSPEWIRCYLRAFEPNSEVIVIAVLIGERMLAVLPLTRKRVWYRGIPLIELKGAANAHSVWFDILRAPGPDGDQGLSIIWDYLRNLTGWHVLEFPYVPEQGAARQLLQQAAEAGFETLIDPCAECPVVNLHVGVDGRLDPFATTSTRFRHELRRSLRRLAEELGTEPKLTCWRKPDTAVLQRFYDLEAAGWKGSAGTAIQNSQDTATYYREIIQLSEKNGHFFFHRFELRDRMLAACLGLRVGRSFYGLKMAYDESLRAYSPGQLMLRGIIEECAQASVSRIVLGGKLDTYKKRWTSETEPLVSALVYRTAVRSRVAFFGRSRLFPAMRTVLEWAQSIRAQASAGISNTMKRLKHRVS